MTDTDHDGAPPGTLAARTLSALRTARAEPDDAPPESPATTRPAEAKGEPAAAIATKPAAAKTTKTAKTTSARTASSTRTATTKTTTAKTTTATKTAKTTTTTKAAAASTPPRGSRPIAVALLALVVAAAVFAGVAGVVWWRAGHDGTRTAARERDAAALAARLDVAALNTLDYRKPDAALAKWLAVSTGTVHDQFAQSAKSAAGLIAQAKTSTAGTVLDAAVSSLDTRRGTATVLVSINVKRIPATGAATTSRNRYLATMKRVGSQWKISDLQIVEVQLA